MTEQELAAIEARAKAQQLRARVAPGWERVTVSPQTVADALRLVEEVRNLRAAFDDGRRVRQLLRNIPSMGDPESVEVWLRLLRDAMNSPD
jgi:hypothetical protein